MYHTQQTTSGTRNTLQSDVNPDSQPYVPKDPSLNPESLPSITSMSLPGLPPSRHSPESRAAMNANISSSSSASHSYSHPHSHSYASEVDYPSTRSQYGTNTGMLQLNYATRDNRLPSQSDPYYHPNMPSRPSLTAEDFVSQLDSALMPDPYGSSIRESQSSRSPEHPDEDDTAESRRARREKPRIELAPDQPLTTQGKPRARVYVACVQWLVHLIKAH